MLSEPNTKVNPLSSFRKTKGQGDIAESDESKDVERNLAVHLWIETKYTNRAEDIDSTLSKQLLSLRDDAISYIAYASKGPINSRRIANQNLALIEPDQVWNLFIEDMASVRSKVSENGLLFEPDVHLNAPEPLIKRSDGPAY
jgi:hypothetical protein